MWQITFNIKEIRETNTSNTKESRPYGKEGNRRRLNIKAGMMKY